MLFIAHRINSIELLKQVPYEYGVEIDLRDTPEGDLILRHDPFTNKNDESTTMFIDWCRYYNHAILICNIKSEGIEWKVKEILNKFNIKSYFFLDSSIPMIMKLIKSGEDNIAIRYSEVEHDVSFFIGKCKWLWVDCFTKYPEIQNEYKTVFKICIVGPTLQGHNWDINNKWKDVYAVCDKLYNDKIWK